MLAHNMLTGLRWRTPVRHMLCTVYSNASANTLLQKHNLTQVTAINVVLQQENSCIFVSKRIALQRE